MSFAKVITTSEMIDKVDSLIKKVKDFFNDNNDKELDDDVELIVPNDIHRYFFIEDDWGEKKLLIHKRFGDVLDLKTLLDSGECYLDVIHLNILKKLKEN